MSDPPPASKAPSPPSGIDPDRPERASATASSRRAVVSTLLGGLGACAVAAPLVPVLGSVCDPLLRKRQSDDGFLTVGNTQQLKGAQPVELSVVGDHRDAWIWEQAQSLGSVWVRQTEAGKVLSLSGSCPHLGCRVGYQVDAKEFVCPCHDGRFDVAGKVLSGPAKRGMDPLATRIDNGLVQVRFRRFRANIAERVELG